MIDGYATHLPALVAAASIAEGPWLELGCGFYSTPVLAALSQVRGIELEVLSTTFDWAEKIRPYHEVSVIPSWNWKPDREYGLCFLDNELLVRERVLMLPMLLKACEIVVMHDWKGPACEGGVVYNLMSPATLVCSYTRDVSGLWNS